jgi:hypothetical protein
VKYYEINGGQKLRCSVVYDLLLVKGSLESDGLFRTPTVYCLHGSAIIYRASPVVFCSSHGVGSCNAGCSYFSE